MDTSEVRVEHGCVDDSVMDEAECLEVRVQRMACLGKGAKDANK